MARETKTVQCYPSDEKINETCARYGSFGWELIGNQRCEEDKGTYDGYRHWTTFNKLTFTREKTSPWYDEVTTIEREYDAIMRSEPNNYAVKPGKGFLLYGICGIIIGICIMLMLFGMGAPFSIMCIGLGVVAIGAILLIAYIVKNSHYKRDTADYYLKLSQWKHTSGKEAEEKRKKAEQIVNGTKEERGKDSASASITEGSINERLQKIKNLLDEGLISQEEYDERRAKIISNI